MKSYNQILSDMLHTVVEHTPISDLNAGSVINTMLMPSHPTDRLVYFLIKLQCLSPAACRAYMAANPGDVSFFIFRYAHNMGPL